MKKTIVLLLTALSVISANAQLKVNQDGKVAIGVTNTTSNSLLRVGSCSDLYSFSGITAGISLVDIESG